ncbi:MAG: DUF1819 family protein [candidate division NC10 bacterium]|nr:DUF1819 family protein [candidate division NC10 bacterium]
MASRYSTKIIKAGALPADSRAFLRAYDLRLSLQQNLRQALRENIFGKASRSRVQDILPIFRQRFLTRPGLARALHCLVEADVHPAIVDRILYYHAAKADVLLYEFVTDFVYKKRQAGESALLADDARRYVTGLVRSQALAWSPTTIRRVTQGLLATLRDFRILEGAARKRLAPVYLPLEVFLYVVFALHLENSSGERLIHHGDWRLFLVTPGEVEAWFLEAHRLKWLDYQVAGRLVRVELHLTTPEELIHAIAGRTDEDTGSGSIGRSHADQRLP